MLAFLLFGTFGFWLIFGLICAAIVVSCVIDSSWCFVFTAAIFAFCVYASEFHLLGWMNANWPLIIPGVIVYLAIGTFWSIFKWREFCFKVKEEILEAMQTKEKYGVPDIPLFYRNKQKVASWIVYWPASAFWWLTYDLVHSIVRKMKGVYIKITMGVFDDLPKELKDKYKFDLVEQESQRKP